MCYKLTQSQRIACSYSNIHRAPLKTKLVQNLRTLIGKKLHSKILLRRIACSYSNIHRAPLKTKLVQNLRTLIGKKLHSKILLWRITRSYKNTQEVYIILQQKKE